MFEIVIDLFFVGKGFVTEPARHCYMEWKEDSADTLERVCEAPRYETADECADWLRFARAQLFDAEGLAMAREQRAVPLRVRCRAVEERVG